LAIPARNSVSSKHCAQGLPFRRASAGSASAAGAATADDSLEPPRPALALPDKPSIAILPFANLSSDPEQDYFADGVVDDITTALSRFKSLFVIARNSSFTYKGRAVELSKSGESLASAMCWKGVSARPRGKFALPAN